MGTSALPSSVSPSSFTDWFNSDDLFTALTRELSSTSGSSSCSSSPQERRAFLHSNSLDGLHLQAQAPFSQVGSPVISSNSVSKDKPESPFNTDSSCVSAMSNLSMPNANSTESSAPHHFQAFQGGSNQPGNSILKPREENSPSCVSSLLSSAEAAASGALSSHGSAGAGATKVSKRRPRINKKAPIAVLSADTSNFRAMVQQLTGIPTSHASPHIWGTSGAPLLRPQPTRLSFNGALPTLDTSASFLNPKQIFPFLQRAPQPLVNGLLSGGANNNAAELAAFQHRGSMVNYDTLSSCTSLPGRWDAMGSGKPSVKEISASNLVRECEQTFPRQSATLFESLLLSEDDLHAKSSYNTVDSWLAFDGGALSNHSPRVDLAKISS